MKTFKSIFALCAFFLSAASVPAQDSAVGYVGTKDLQNRSVTDIGSALQGKVAGLQVLNLSGAPGSSPSLRIRGYNAEMKDYSPLLIVDGIQVDNLRFLDPSVVESVEVLKDAAATAIYGQRAVYGAIIIKTKNGKTEKGGFNVSYEAKLVSQSLAKKAELFDAKGFAEYQGITAKDDTDTDWQEVMFAPSMAYQHSISLSGSNDKAHVFANVNYLDNDGIVKGEKDKYSRLTARLNAGYDILDFLSVGVNASYEHWNLTSVSEKSQYGSLINSILTTDPLTPTHYANIDEFAPGMLANFVNPEGLPIMIDPENGLYLATSNYNYRSYSGSPLIKQAVDNNGNVGNTLRLNAFAKVRILKGLDFTTSFGITNETRTGSSYTPAYYATEYTKSDKYYLSASRDRRNYKQWTSALNYNIDIAKHNIAARLGYLLTIADNEKVTENTYSNKGINYNPKQDYFQSGIYTDKVQNLLSEPDNRTINSYSAGLGYNYDKRYGIQAAFSLDGYDVNFASARYADNGEISSSTGANIKDATTTSYSVLANWTLSNEGFISKNVSEEILSYLNFRASWGNINSYGFTEQSGYYTGNVWASNITELNMLDLGLDARLLDDRLAMTIDWYEKNEKTDLMPNGVSGAPARTPYVAVLNSGMELSASWSDSVGDFNYSIAANMSTLNNEVSGFGDGIAGISGMTVYPGSSSTNTVSSVLRQGYPVWSFEADENDKIIGSPIPNLLYGLTVNMEYKGIDFTIFGNGVSGNELLYFFESMYDNTLTAFADTVSEYLVMDGSYFRIKQLQLGYTIPSKLTRRVGIENLRVYASLDDFFTFSSYPGLDPETATLSAVAGNGFDVGSYPMMKKLLFGIRLNF